MTNDYNLYFYHFEQVSARIETHKYSKRLFLVHKIISFQAPKRATDFSDFDLAMLYLECCTLNHVRLGKIHKSLGSAVGSASVS